MIIKTAEVEGVALDWAVANALGLRIGVALDVEYQGAWLPLDSESLHQYVIAYSPSSDWSQGGPLIESHGVRLEPPRFEGNSWWAGISEAGSGWNERFEMIGGSTALIAAMRAIVAIVASELGDEVDVPEELTHNP